ncbi:hypothetical protein BJV74DRAFT_848008 [Russula compacta]|nr:hypothetical protein BJV74DRAFT_848008 [Russula compacta]
MQSNFLQTINALLQQFQQSQPTQNPPPPPQIPSVNVLQQHLQQTIQAIDQHSLQQASVSGLFQSLQQQTSQAPAPGASISPSQLLYDALQMIAPVGQSPNDEQLLAMALHCGLSQGLDHRRAIETLHGVNNHAANLWKDYYLEHKFRIDEMLNQLQPIKIAKEPTRSDSESKVFSASSEIKGKRPKEPSANGSPPTVGMRRHRGPSRHSNLPIPPPPEVEPTPPTKIVKTPRGRGNNYTVEDKKYFAKYISWALQVDPSLTKGELIAKLAENVPHHTAKSWASYWARDPLAHRLLAASRERAMGVYQDQVSIGDAEEEEGYSEDDQELGEASSHSSDEDEAAMMSEPGSMFSAAEVRVMAKYIARHDPDEWAMMTGKQRWFPFHEEHPHRSDKAYGEKYRAMEQEFLRLAVQYRKRAQRQLEKQCGTPSWAHAGGRKRRSSAHESPSKRVRDLD